MSARNAARKSPSELFPNGSRVRVATLPDSIAYRGIEPGSEGVVTHAWHALPGCHSSFTIAVQVQLDAGNTVVLLANKGYGMSDEVELIPS